MLESNFKQIFSFQLSTGHGIVVGGYMHNFILTSKVLLFSIFIFHKHFQFDSKIIISNADWHFSANFLFHVFSHLVIDDLIYDSLFFRYNHAKIKKSFDIMHFHKATIEVTKIYDFF